MIDAFEAALVGLDRRLRAHRQNPAPGQIGLPDHLAAEQLAAGREVGARDDLEELLHREVGILDQLEQRVADFAEIVRRDIRRHPNRDSVRAIDQQIRNLRRQNFRLLLRAVEVIDEIDGILVDIGQHPLGQSRQAAFGVAIGGGRVAVDRAEIALAVDQRVTHAEGLRHAHQRIVHRAVAVRMVPLEHFADDAGAFGVAARESRPSRNIA